MRAAALLLALAVGLGGCGQGGDAPPEDPALRYAQETEGTGAAAQEAGPGGLQAGTVELVTAVGSDAPGGTDGPEAPGREDGLAGPVPLSPLPEAGRGSEASQTVPGTGADPSVDAATPVEPVPEPPVSAEVSAAQRACLRRGGRFVPVTPGSSLRRCIVVPKDANQRCETGRDCEGVCLARSRTCAPSVPLRGCHEVVLDQGGTAVQCLQ